MKIGVTEDKINEFGRFDNLKATVHKTLARQYFEAISGTKMPILKVNQKIDEMLRNFILKDGYDILMAERGSA